MDICRGTALCESRKGASLHSEYCANHGRAVVPRARPAEIFRFPHGWPADVALLYVQGVIEIVGGLLLLVGVFTRVVAFVLAGDMAVAYFLAHFPRSFFPAVNAGDAAVLYCFIFLYMMFAGGGIWSVDRATGLDR